jgi:2-keto-4-pentenoate hydratase/2-oxohepta-3-ene-1,7-dioic acid hydratase in catechol pathway
MLPKELSDQRSGRRLLPRMTTATKVEGLVRLVTFTESDEKPRPGALQGDRVVDLSDQVGSVRNLIEGGPELQQSVQEFLGLLGKTHSQFSIAQVTLLAPILNPPRIFCLGLAYRDHAIETHQAIPKVPTIFLKLTSALNGPHSAVVLPKLTRQPDYEAEFAFVIGKGGKNIPADRWQEHVFGYTIMNDISARDVQMSTSQWSLGKSFDTFAPLGPAIVTKDEIPDPHSLDIKLSIGGETLQHSNTRELIFRNPDLIAYISSIISLQPGDIISTGTPSGVGLGRTPHRWLRPGETIITEIQGIGQLVNPVVAEA